jgi:ADP-heptose:LPS heptosyltransferase/Tfp pilus assembly protein PilF
MNQNNFEKAKTHFDRGVNFFNNFEYDLSEKEFLFCLELVPDRLSAVSNLIKIYIVKEDAVKLKDFLERFNHIKHQKEVQFGIAYSDYFNNKYDNSIVICNNLLSFSELELEALSLLARNYIKKKEFLTSLKIYKKILLKKKDFEIYYNIGNLLFGLGKTRQAYYFFKKSNNLNSEHKSTLWNMSLCLLRLKDFTKGFQLYETRWLKKNAEKKRYTNIPLATDISQIFNKKILIWQEQGLGDTIQFSRFVIDLNKYSKNITLVVHKKLKDLLSYISPLVRVIEYDLLDLEKEKFDFQLPICSLPKFLEIKKIEDISYYKLQLPKKNIRNLDYNILNIGLAWSGNPNYPNDEYRSIPFKYFKRILNFNKTNFYKLSKDLRIQELLDYNSYNIIDLGDKDFSDLSHLVKDLDLVISSDTSIIHLSGILGINSILLLNFNSDWRWFDSYKITPWYPSVKIIKQKKLNDWEYVFEQLNDEIKVIHKKKFN